MYLTNLKISVQHCILGNILPKRKVKRKYKGTDFLPQNQIFKSFQPDDFLP